MNAIRIGLGCGPLGAMSDGDAVRLVHAALDMGVRVFDTAPSYGASESHLGRALEGRDAFVITKGGYGVEGVGDWTPACIRLGIDRALRILRRPIDAFLLHSCPQRDDLIEPLLRAKSEGKVRAIGYSGDGDPLAWAALCGAFDVLECSVSLFDQRALDVIPNTKRVFAKRPLGNAPWRSPSSPYVDRWRAMFDPEEPLFELAIRFAAHATDCALVGTTREAHLRDAIRAASLGPTDRFAELRAHFSRFDFPGIV